MAQLIYSNCYLLLGGTVDVSSAIRSCVPNLGFEMHDDTVMGDTGKSRAKGLEDWSFDVEIEQNFVDNEMDEDLYGLFAAGSVAVAWKPVNAAIGTGNPQYAGTGIMESYQPVSEGRVGALAVTKFRILSKGTALERTTA